MTKSTSYFSRFALLAAAITVITSIFLGAIAVHAQMGRKSDSHGKLIGAPVFAADNLANPDAVAIRRSLAFVEGLFLPNNNCYDAISPSLVPTSNPPAAAPTRLVGMIPFE